MKKTIILFLMLFVLTMSSCSVVEETTFNKDIIPISCNIKTITTINTIDDIVYPIFIDEYYVTFNLDSEIVECVVSSDIYRYFNKNINNKINVEINKKEYDDGSVKYLIQKINFSF